MNEDAVKLFHELMKKGWIDRHENASAWALIRDPHNLSDVSDMGKELGFVLYPSGDRYYLIPTQDNDLFLKNNMDFRKDISAPSDFRTRDLYLMNYLAVFLLYEFFHGESEITVRDFITKEDLIADFNEHTQNVTKEDIGEQENDISEDFKKIAVSWLGKKEGDDPESRKIDEKYGIVNRLLSKFKADELFTDENGTIRPARKLKDLMPYVLRKDRTVEINKWIEERTEDAADK